MIKHPEKTALNVMKGVPEPGQINQELVKKLKGRKAGAEGARELIDGILSGNRVLLSRAITLVESSLKQHQDKAQEVIAGCLKHRGSIAPGIRLGITGVPGVGKSTFIEAFGKYLTSQGHRVAVLAIDPSSARSKGSILGDKTRMEELATDPQAFIRPSPSAGSLGGVARKTRETIILCEAAGFDVIIVETVGVGQSETAVHGMVDFFLLLMLAGAGDELQGIKRGIIEMADAIIINKADGDNLNKAKMAAAEYRNALHLFPPSETGWTPLVDICSAQTRMGIPRVWDIISDYCTITRDNGHFHKRRMSQEQQVMFEVIDEALRHQFYGRKDIRALIDHYTAEIYGNRMSPYLAAQLLLEKFRS
ncbi:MAG TPA: methylmalonyl Co-A mutase-associated GTPase MeaB [Bacteroidales bacterium]|nr:methylmalonyl Co-A mutase-associated GTPase MeaB [Bacteroidales bacterium]